MKETSLHLTVWFAQLAVLYNYGELIGVTVGGELGCIIASIFSACVQFLRDILLSLLGRPVKLEPFVAYISNQACKITLYVATIDVDIFQAIYFSSLFACIFNIANSLIKLVCGKEKAISSKFFYALFVVCAAILLSDTSTYFWQEKDKLRDILTAPSLVRDVENTVYEHAKPFLNPLFMGKGCSVSIKILKNLG
jgi:hypothetical protein